MRFYLNPKNWPIMLKIALGVLASSLIPLIFIAYINFNGSVQTIENSEYRNIELLANAIAGRLDQLMLDNAIAAAQLGSDTEIITLVSDPSGASNVVRASVTASMKRILVSNPQYEYVYLLDKTGKVILSQQLDSVPSVEGQDFSNRAYFTETMKGKPYIDVLVGRANKKLGFYFSSPILGADGKPVGVSIVKLKGEAVTGIVNEFKAGRTGYAFLVDQDGVIVSHRNQDWYYSSLTPLTRDVELKIGQRFVLNGCEDPKNLASCKVKSLNLPVLAQVISNANASTGSSGTGARHGNYISPTDGSEQIVGVANTTQLNWRVVVNEAKSEFTAPLNFLALRTILSVLAIGILAGIGGVLLARVITQPLGKLSQVAQAIQSGGAPHPEELAEVTKQGDEVGHLARVFKGMLDSLDARVSELHAINVVSRKISSSFNVGTTLTLVLNSVRSVVPYDRALVMLYDPEAERFCTRATGDGRGFYLNRVWNEEDTPAIHYKNDGYLQRFFADRKHETLRVLEPDLSQPAEFALTYAVEWGGFEARSYLGVPLLFKDEIIGVIELASAKAESFNANHARVLELIAGQAAIAVRNALDVEQRETELRRQIDELRVEVDEGKKQKNVEEIIESDYFQALSSKADKIRQRRQEESDAAAESSGTGSFGGESKNSPEDAPDIDKPGSNIPGEK